MSARSNHLINESSPYLLQHAHNPVEWFPWGEAALSKAKVENKPILVSIGYSACHWCHVMERESFENDETAAFMNEHFINIKIDREERPDLDHIYMEAVQAISGSGGWPLNVFLTTDCKPFYGGTYFPPVQAYNRPSWMDVLAGVSKSYRENPGEILSQAENLTAHLLKSNSIGQSPEPDTKFQFPLENNDRIFEQIMQAADRNQGGFGRAPKFPQTFTIHYLLLYYHSTGNEESIKQALLSLDEMYLGGIYDQLGGGFARYSTDPGWLVPHFEKMLYDNALLMMVYADAYQITGREEYRQLIEHTVEFLQRDLASPKGGFFAALDADSEGVEGKYYVWDQSEIDRLLGEDALIFSKYYNVSRDGNWEGKNILHRTRYAEVFVQENGLDSKHFHQLVNESCRKLLENRNNRVKPQLDDKIILGWNALMITALCKGSAATGSKLMLDMAIRAEEFLRAKFGDSLSGGYFHTYKSGQARVPAFLDDYAFLIQSMIILQELTGDRQYLLRAKELAEFVIRNFMDDEKIFFFFTHEMQKDVVIRKKEVYDGAIPSGNSVMAWNLLYLSVIFDRAEWKETVVKMLNRIGETTLKFPTSFGNWAALIHKLTMGVSEIVVTGRDTREIHAKLLPIFMPNKVLQLSSIEDDQFPLLKQKSFADKAVIYLCKNYSCHAPVNDVDSLVRMIENDPPFS
ncbi:MAG: thioredoxin domain-containing protein [Chitinophagaceae bacterium]